MCIRDSRIRSGQQLLRLEAKLCQILQRQIDAAHGRIFFDVADDVGQLKREAALLGQRLGCGKMCIRDSQGTCQIQLSGHRSRG